MKNLKMKRVKSNSKVKSRNINLTNQESQCNIFNLSNVLLLYIMSCIRNSQTYFMYITFELFKYSYKLQLVQYFTTCIRNFVLHIFVTQ